MGYSLPLQSTGICSMGTVRLPDGRMMERVEHFTGPKGHRKLMISRHNHASDGYTTSIYLPLKGPLMTSSCKTFKVNGDGASTGALAGSMDLFHYFLEGG